jgi:deazaflavin-dependent oxidoreductase (nitroreductase family)
VPGTAKPYSPGKEHRLRRRLRIQARINIWLYRKSNGRIGGKYRNAPIGLITTTGRHSGMARTVPLFYLEDGERVVLVASKRGMSTNPDWYLNIEANPRVTVDLEGDARAMLARTATPQEKAEYWPRLVEMFKLYQQYEDRTARDIPVVICTPGA